ncbi:Ribonuclease H-like superfamily [Sesbania bispinosa]|nr:Ribonuclease H-like superfamily [Sesbania bispinosa]
MTVERRFSNVILESDSKNAINFVLRGLPKHHPCYNLVQNIKSLARSFHSVVWSHVFREANTATDAMAHMGQSLNCNYREFSSLPSQVDYLILADLASVSRRRGG